MRLALNIVWLERLISPECSEVGSRAVPRITHSFEPNALTIGVDNAQWRARSLQSTGSVLAVGDRA
jgi:hypothetical protein